MNVLVVGGGIIGCAIARELARRGASVTLIEAQAELAQEASGAAVGTLSYSPSSPMPEGWHWLAGRSLVAHRALQQSLASEIETSPLWHFPGRLNVATTNAAEKNARMRLKADERAVELDTEEKVKWRWMDKAEIHALEPALAPAVQGGSFNPNQGWVDAPALTRALAESAYRAKVLFRNNTTVEGFWVGGHPTPIVMGVATNRGAIRADVTIITAGAWAGELDERFALPVFPVRGQALHIPLPAEPPIRHLISGNGIYMIPDGQGVTVGATHEEVGFMRGVAVGGVGKLLQYALQLVPGVGEGDYSQLRAWSGFRPATPDKTPILGADPRAKGLWWATGHFRSGILLAPVSATIMADAILEDKPIPDLLRPDRFLG
jgi:glycine oxidase ThiO